MQKKNYLQKEEGKEGGEKSMHSASAGPGARTWDLPRARRGSPAARHGGFWTSKPFRTYRYGRAIAQHQVLHVLEIVFVRLCKIL